MKDGKIVESGTCEGLIDKNGYYNMPMSTNNSCCLE